MAPTLTSGLPSTQPSCRGRADDCIARMMRKSNHVRAPSDAALLLLWGVWLLVRHALSRCAAGGLATAWPG